ncbi:MAG: phage holin family protein [Pseudomonadota bacterium]|nr:phage holin family protein [Pseudomonadota bacterium]
MRHLIIRWSILTVAILAAAYFVEGFHVRGFSSALFAAAFLGILNALFRPILLLLTLPVNILTLGLFTFVINALLLKMTAGVIPGFDLQGFQPALFGALIISIVNGLLHLLISDSVK